MKIVREIESKRAIYLLSEADNIELTDDGLYVNRRGILHVKPSEHEIVDGPAPDLWAAGGALRFADGEWSVVDQQAYQAAQDEHVARHASDIRAERNRRLSACDWTQVADAPVDQAAWATYREALRDLPDQPGFPSEVTWPVAPAQLSQ